MTSILGMPVIGFSDTEDSRKKESYGSSARNIGGIQSHRQMVDQRRAPSQADMGGIREEDMRVPQAKKSAAQDSKSRPSKNNMTKHHTDKKDNKDEDDDNPNLVGLAEPAPANIRNNLQINDSDRALNRQMMLNGPQGGFQNNQPRGIGNSADY